MMSTTAMGGGGGGGGRSCSSSKFPFTSTQWQELEHQALIYKYMTAGVPIPPDLLFTIKHSLQSSLSSKFFSTYHPSTSPLGWNAYNQMQMGYGKKIDPEPGRCRRTDGKKWRCSKEAYPDSKYCERHMHRGKNRSRKPVEIPNPNLSPNHNNNNNNNNSGSPLTPASANHHQTVTVASSSSANSTHSCPTNLASLTHHQSVIINSPSPLYSLSSVPSSDSPNNCIYSHPYYSHKDYASRERYIQGLKPEVGEHAFLKDNSSEGSNVRSGTIDESWQFVGYNNDNNSKPNNSQGNHQMKKHQEKQCYIWGRDFSCELSMRVEEERENHNDKTTHLFLDEWPLKTAAGGGGNSGGGGGGGRVDKDSSSSSWHDSPSTTQLSISIPTSTNSHHHHHDFFLSNSRTHLHDG